MQGILFAEKPRARQLYLDARTKIILCLTVSFLMFSCEYTGVMRFVLPVLAAVPFVSFLILRRYRKAAVYGMVYVLCLMLPMLLRSWTRRFSASSPVRWRRSSRRCFRGSPCLMCCSRPPRSASLSEPWTAFTSPKSSPFRSPSCFVSFLRSVRNTE